jgi:hypothetical protein
MRTSGPGPRSALASARRHRQASPLELIGDPYDALFASTTFIRVRKSIAQVLVPNVQGHLSCTARIVVATSDQNSCCRESFDPRDKTGGSAISMFFRSNVASFRIE